MDLATRAPLKAAVALLIRISHALSAGRPAVKLAARQTSRGTTSRGAVVIIGEESAEHGEEASEFQKHVRSLSRTLIPSAVG